VSRAGKPAAELSVSPLTINAPAEGGEFPVTIKSNYPWTANATLGSFFSLSTKSGDGDATMIITVKSATSEKESTGTIVINSSFGNESARINIKRAGKPKPQLKIYPALISTTADGGEFTLNLTANCGWKGTSSDTKVASFHPQSGTGSATISVIVAPTALKTSSYATFTFTTDDGSITETVEVRRAGTESTYFVQKSFSVAKSKRVLFSYGNLQYDPSSDKWSFASSQDEFFGIRAGVRDLFLWGTGNDPLAKEADFVFDEWGAHEIYFQESVFKKDVYRTLTSDEWDYVLNSRTNASQLRGWATVNKKHGFVLLPDEWILPSGLGFIPSEASYNTNVYTKEDWRKMEKNGAVFLPASGYMYESALGEFGTTGYYWSSSTKTEKVGFAEWEIVRVCFMFGPEDYDATAVKVLKPAAGASVRLVCDLDGLK